MQLRYTVRSHPANTYNYDPYNQTIKDMWYNNLYGKGNCVDQILDCAARGINEICQPSRQLLLLRSREHLRHLQRTRRVRPARTHARPIPARILRRLPQHREGPSCHRRLRELNRVQHCRRDGLRYDGRRQPQAADRRGHAEASRSEPDGHHVHGRRGLQLQLAGRRSGQQRDRGPRTSARQGYTNITTSDGIVHGQVKQAGKFAFLRIYESGHEVPFYQPVVALEMFERALKGTDMATGERGGRGNNYLTKGTVKSTYREGNGTIQFSRWG